MSLLVFGPIMDWADGWIPDLQAV